MSSSSSTRSGGGGGSSGSGSVPLATYCKAATLIANMAIFSLLNKIINIIQYKTVANQ